VVRLGVTQPTVGTWSSVLFFTNSAEQQDMSKDKTIEAPPMHKPPGAFTAFRWFFFCATVSCVKPAERKHGAKT
jgi:hypothetical protein